MHIKNIVLQQKVEKIPAGSALIQNAITNLK